MSPISREYYRVPRGNRESYIRPPVAELPAVVEENRRLAAAWDFSFAGRPVADFRAAARAEVVAAARQFSEHWNFKPPARPWTEPQPIVVTGHQPPPFHPGVWIKNFLAASLAGKVGGAAINLTVDSDEVRDQVLRYPTRLGADGAEMDHARVAEVAFAPEDGGMALEEQSSEVLQAELVPDIRRFAPGPVVEAGYRYLFELIPRLRDDATLAEALAAARHALEEYTGVHNLELPISRLADTEAFRLFAAEALRRRENLWIAYNDSLAEYRRAYRERSLAQPVPDLARDGPRLELPLWVWRTGQPRRHLWAELIAGGELALFANNEPIGRIGAADLANADATATRLAALRAEGWKIRPKALTLTLFVRLAVGDVFIHGLGGALYEKITDGLFERWLGIRAPGIILASATVHLSLPAYPATETDLASACRAVRQWRHNPDRMLGDAVRGRPEVAVMIDEKRQLVGGMAALARPDRRAAYIKIHQLNEILAAAQPEGPQQAAERLTKVQRDLASNAILRGREYPFFFYDVNELAKFYSAECG
jgi:hypothetical protein